MKLLQCGVIGIFVLLNGMVSASDDLLTLPSLSATTITLPKGVLRVANRVAPPPVLDDIDGNRFDPADRKGPWVFVHFWASRCGPCRREIPTIQRMAEKVQDDQLALAIINTAESEDTVFTFLGVLAPDLVPLMDRDGLGKAMAVKELQSQWPLAEKVIKTDHVIDNCGLLPDTNSQVGHLAELLK